MERIRSKKKPAPKPKAKARAKVAVPTTKDCSASSNLVEAKWDKPTKTLVVTFKGGGRYAYDGVPEFQWRNFCAADSQGKYLAAEIKPNFPARKLEPADA